MADTSGLVSLAGAFISAGAAVTTVVLTRRTAVRDRQAAAAELALRYQEPLLHAAFNLQSRLYNIARPTGHRFLDRFLTQGTPAEAEYARVNTVYLLGQYLCWGEILRRESQFVDPVDRQRDREVTVGMERVREVLADSLTFTDPVLRVFRGEQRAIGEVLLTKTDNPSDRAGPRWDCLGYAAFVKALDDTDTARWFATLLADVGHHGRRAGRAPGPAGRPAACPARADQPARPQRRPGLRPAPPTPLNRTYGRRPRPGHPPGAGPGQPGASRSSRAAVLSACLRRPSSR